MFNIETNMTSKIYFVLAIFCFTKLSNSAEIESRLNNEPDREEVYETVVVGLGVSGLAAFSALARHGRRVLGLEGAARLGGRVNTQRFGDGLVEVGAEWIHGRKNSPTYELALANNVTLKYEEMTVNMTGSDGSVVDMQLTNQLLENCLFTEDKNTKLETQAEMVIQLCNDYIAKNKPELFKDSKFIRELYVLFEHLSNSNDGSDRWTDLTSKSTYVDLDEWLKTSWHKNGYKTLIEIILNKYNNRSGLPENADMKLNKEVDQIQWSKEPVSNILVKCKDGSTYKAKNVIVTVSLGVLKERHVALFSPPLSQNNLNAIEKISMGILNKIILSFDKVWWPENTNFFLFLWKTEDKAKVPKEDEWITEIASASRSMASNNVLVLWISGKSARHIETLSDKLVKEKSIELLRKFINKDATEPTGIIKSSWFTNPFTRGSYTYDNVQTPQNPGLREALSAPLLDSSGQPRVLFAGEATNPTHFGTVHGAYETGIREANRLLGVGSNSFVDPTNNLGPK